MFIAAVNLVMDRIANRPRGYAFLRYSTEEESKRAIEGMHGKVLFFLPCYLLISFHYWLSGFPKS
jgi:RNA recognition motif-containing protein